MSEMIKNKIIEAIALVKKSEKKLSGEETFQELGIDDLDKFELILKLEDLFMIEISDDEAEKMVSIPVAFSSITSILNSNNPVEF